MNLPKTCLVLAFSPLLLATHAVGALITWDTPTNVDTTATGTTQILNIGTTVAAFTVNPGIAPVTINDVTFKSLAATTNVSLARTSTAGAYGSAGTDYNNILRYGIYVANGTSATTPSVISGLTDGQTYLIQIWTPFWDHNYMTLYSSSAPNGVSPTSTAPNQSALLNLGFGLSPQFITGTFTAIGTTQNFYAFGNEKYGMIAALQVRAVPEPSTVALGAIGLAGLFFRLRRKQRLE